MRTLFILLFSLPLFALSIGTPLPPLSLDGDEGGRVDGSAWSSESLKEKVHVIFYVDPDEKDLNNAFSDALKAEGFDRGRFASVAIINMDATWLPNIAIKASLKKKQEKFPHTIYVKDMHKKGITAWKIADDNSDIIITDKTGTVVYVHEGQIPQSDFGRIINLIKEHM